MPELSAADFRHHSGEDQSTMFTPMEIVRETLTGFIYLATLFFVVIALPTLSLINSFAAYRVVMPIAFLLIGLTTLLAITLRKSNGEWLVSNLVIAIIGRLSIVLGFFIAPFLVSPIRAFHHFDGVLSNGSDACLGDIQHD